MPRRYNGERIRLACQAIARIETACNTRDARGRFRVNPHAMVYSIAKLSAHLTEWLRMARLDHFVGRSRWRNPKYGA